MTGWHPDMPEHYRDQIVTGDARELASAIPDESVDLIFTDPVYDRIDDYRWLAETAARVLRPGASWLAFTGVNEIAAVLRAVDAPYRGMLCWRLNSGGGGGHHKRYGKTIDNGAWLLWFGGWPVRYCPLVWESGYWGHVTDFHWQKNPLLIGRHISDFCPDDGMVLDPFGGSGSVPAICKMLGRHYVAFEIDPATAERARERVANTTPPLPGIDEPTQMEMEEV